MKARDVIWHTKEAAERYAKMSLKFIPGAIDEEHVKKYISSKRNVKIVSLGIGTGRELSWLKNFKNIKEIIGIDYSKAMLMISRRIAKTCKKKIVLIQDNLLSLKKFKTIIKKEKLPIIYICLINTLGNFKARERERILKNIKELAKREDRVALCLYKIPERIKTRIKLPPHIIVKGKRVKKIEINLAIEYALNEVIWAAVTKKFKRIPRFWYEEDNRDIVTYIGRKKIFISHRFSKEEIKKLCKTVKLKIEKIIEGKFMWVVILKI